LLPKRHPLWTGCVGCQVGDGWGTAAGAAMIKTRSRWSVSVIAAGGGHLGRQGRHRYNDYVQHSPVDVGACRAGLLNGLNREFADVAGTTKHSTWNT
jgi:hypothetical protein